MTIQFQVTSPQKEMLVWCKNAPIGNIVLHPYEKRRWFLDSTLQNRLAGCPISTDFKHPKRAMQACEVLDNFKESIRPRILFRKAEDFTRDPSKRNSYQSNYHCMRHEVLFDGLKIGEVITGPYHNACPDWRQYKPCWRPDDDLCDFLQMPVNLLDSPCRVTLEACKHMVRIILHKKQIQRLPLLPTPKHHKKILDYLEFTHYIIIEKTDQLLEQALRQPLPKKYQGIW